MSIWEIPGKPTGPTGPTGLARPAGPAGGDDIALTTPVSAAVPRPWGRGWRHLPDVRGAARARQHRPPPGMSRGGMGQAPGTEG